jgi:hypothetical protein
LRLGSCTRPTVSRFCASDRSYYVNGGQYRSASCERRVILDWLRVEHGIDKASLKLKSPTELDSDAFVSEVKRIRGKKNPLSAGALKSLRDEHARTIEPVRAQAGEAQELERRLSALVNEAYGLTPDEVALMWQTAPLRMPFAGPVGESGAPI